MSTRMLLLTRGAVVVLLALAALLTFAVSENPAYFDARIYADTAEHIAAGDGIRTGVPNGEGVLPDLKRPQYPPGLPVALAPFAAVDHLRVGARLLSFLALLAVAWAAWALAGPLAALIATAAVLPSPFYGESVRTVLSDMPAAGLAAAALALLIRANGSRRLLILAGLACGVGVTVRLSHLPILLAALLAAGAGRRWVAAGALPPLLALAAYQWHAFGAPWRMSYSSGQASWALGNLTSDKLFTELSVQFGHFTPFGPSLDLPNVLFWPAALGLWWVFAPPAFGYLGLVEVWRLRSTVAGRFVALSAVGMLLFLLPYFWQGARIIAPAAVLLVVMAAGAVVQALGWLGRRLAVQTPAAVACTASRAAERSVV